MTSNYKKSIIVAGQTTNNNAFFKKRNTINKFVLAAGYLIINSSRSKLDLNIDKWV